MGNRNPYRISVDKRTGFLYWGEVGPDARADSFATRGPRGYDEVNQARKAGFFGWPLFVGDNYPYHQYDYLTGTSGKLFDAKAPLNESRNNTGLTNLPPAQPAFIWYPYNESAQFPQVGTGGRNAMAGPAYYAEDYNKATRLPDYYNNKLFVYDWVRGWIKAVTMQPNGDFDKMESFISHIKLNAPIDMDLGPDGRMYILEYGNGWFLKNEDAGIARIDYISGKRPPVVKEFTISKTSGLLPYTVRATVNAVDPDKGPLRYIWSVGTAKVETTEPTLTYTIRKPGSYPVSVTAIDEQKISTRSKAVTVYAGNEQAEVNINVKPNKTFYFPRKPIEYSVSVKDKGGKVNMSNLFVSTNNITGFDRAEQPMGHVQAVETYPGKNIMWSSDCKSCHKENSKSIGPSYMQVSKRYANKPNSTAYIVSKILKGSSGVWGENAMPAHPSMKQSDATQIAKWVLSLSNAKTNVSKSLPATGRIMPPATASQKTVTIQASYTDNGGVGMKPLKSSVAAYLRSNVMEAEDLKDVKGFTRKDSADVDYFNFSATTGWIKIPMIDLTNISRIELGGLRLSNFNNNEFSIAVDKPEGEIISSNSTEEMNKIIIPIKRIAGNEFHDVYILYKGSRNRRNVSLLRTISFAP
jgi:cytochrome c551/c552